MVLYDFINIMNRYKCFKGLYHDLHFTCPLIYIDEEHEFFDRTAYCLYQISAALIFIKVLSQELELFYDTY